MQTIVYQCDTAMPAQKLPNYCMIDTVVYKHSWCIEKTDSRREGKTFTAADDYFAKNSRQAMLATTISHTGLYRQSCGNRQSSFRTDP